MFPGQIHTLERYYIILGRAWASKCAEELPPRFDVPLRYLGDWHKQPGSMIQPSHGDLMTARTWLDDDENGADYLLVPIVTVGYAPIIAESDLEVNYISVPMEDGTDMRVDWWYIHRDMPPVFQPVHPKIVAEAELPQMMKYGWHIVLADRLTRETLALADDGLLVRTLFYECDGEVPLEYCFLTIRQGASFLLLLVTQHDYPQTSPKAYRAPFTNELDLMDPVATFQKLWEIAAPIDDPEGWEWSSGKYLIDYVAAIEVDMGLRQPAKVRIPVSIGAGGENDHAPDETRRGMRSDGVLAYRGETESRLADNSAAVIETDDAEEETR